MTNRTVKRPANSFRKINMSMEFVRKRYGVPAKRGGRILYTGDGKEYGTIKSASDGHLNIQLDGIRHTMPFHPTWKIQYLTIEQIRRSNSEA